MAELSPRTLGGTEGGAVSPSAASSRGTSNPLEVSTSPASTTSKRWSSLNPFRVFRQLAYETAGHDVSALKNAIRLFPLKFRDPDDEQSFYLRVSIANQKKLLGLASSVIGFTLVVWGILAVNIILGYFPVANQPASILFHVTFGLLIAGILQIRFALAWFKAPIGNLVLQYSGPLIYLLPNVWVAVDAILQHGGEMEDGLNVQKTKLWTTPIVAGLPLFGYIFVYLISQFRTAQIVPMRIANTVALFALLIVQAHNWGSKERKTPLEIAGQGTFYFFVWSVVSQRYEKRVCARAPGSALECVGLGMVQLVCFFGRWATEVQERIETWKRMRSQEKLKALREVVKHSKKRGSTAVEDLLNIIIKAGACVRDVEAEIHNPLLEEAVDQLRTIENLLTNSENLYAVRLPDSDYAPTAETREEGLLEAQYVRIYGAQHFVGTKNHRPESQSMPLEIITPRNVSKSFASIRPIAPVPTADVELRHNIGVELTYNILEASQRYPNILVELGAVLLEPLSNSLNVSPVQLRNLAYRIQQTYRQNPFHNTVHAAATTHALCCLLRMLRIPTSARFSRTDFALSIIAGLGHDAGHPGRSNQFFTMSLQTLTLIFNDRSVLENFHSAIIFKIMQSESCKFLQSLTPEERAIFRKRLIDLILATDMGQHFQLISKFRLRIKASSFDYMNDLEDMWLMVRTCMKMADLSHCLLSWPQHSAWALMACEELYQQGDEEAALGLPRSPLCDRTLHLEFPKAQRGYMEFVVQPLALALEEADTSEAISNYCIRNLLYNRERWATMTRNEETLPIPQWISQKKSSCNSISPMLKGILLPKGYRYVPKEPKQDSTTSVTTTEERTPQVSSSSSKEALEPQQDEPERLSTEDLEPQEMAPLWEEDWEPTCAREDTPQSQQEDNKSLAQERKATLSSQKSVGGETQVNSKLTDDSPSSMSWESSRHTGAQPVIKPVYAGYINFESQVRSMSGLYRS